MESIRSASFGTSVGRIGLTFGSNILLMSFLNSSLQLFSLCMSLFVCDHKRLYLSRMLFTILVHALKQCFYLEFGFF